MRRWFDKKKLKDVAKIKFCLSQKVISDEKHKIITPINLLENNVIDNFVFDDRVRVNKDTKVHKGDILIKRVSPSFVNYIDEIDEDTYASGNLIIISAVSVESKYLAYILNKEISKITQSLSGAKIPSIGRNDLEEIEVPILSIKRQKAIGDLWHKSIEVYKLKTRLNELEFIKVKGILSELVNGGEQNVN